MFKFGDDFETVDIDGVEVFAVGSHNGREFDESDLAKIVETYNEVSTFLEAPIKAGHSNELAIKDGMPALGWVDDLRKQGKKIVADFRDVPKKVAEMIKSRAFKRVSIELLPKFKDDQGNTYKDVFSGVALLGADIPAVKGINDIPDLFENDEEVTSYTMEIETYAQHSVHEPEFNGTSEKDGEWDSLALSDFGDNPDLSEVDDHFIVSKTGFPPENFGDLSLEVVDPDDNLDPDGLESAHRTVGQVEGLSEDDTNRARNIIERLAENNFDASNINFLESEDKEEMDEDDVAEVVEQKIEEFIDGSDDDPQEEGGSNVDEVEQLKEDLQEYKEKADTLEDKVESLKEENSELQDRVLEYKVDSTCTELGLPEEKEDKFRSFVESQVENYTDDSVEDAIEDAKDLIGSLRDTPDTDEYTADGEEPTNDKSTDEQVESILNA